MRKSTEETLKKIRAMYESGMPVEKIAKELGYKTGSVSVMLRKAGISRESDVSGHITEIVKMRESGMTLKEISEKTGFCVSAICTRLNEAGCRKNIMHNVRPPEAEVDESALIYAAPRKAPARVIEGGKRYVDVLDSLYDTPDIMSL